MRNLQKLNLIKYIFIFLLISCQKENFNPEFSHPFKIKSTKHDSHLQRIVIGATNNFNGEVNGSIEESLPNVKISIGGDRLVKSYVQSLKKAYGKDLILVDGGYFINKKNNKEERERTLRLYKEIDYDAILLTENEIINLQENYSNLPLVNANIINFKEDKIYNQLGSKPYIVKNINGIRVALVGVTTYKKENKEEDKLLGLFFNDPVASLLSIKKQIKKDSDIIILILHSKTECSESQQETKMCPQNIDYFSHFVKRLPPDFIDVIIGGDSNYATGVISGMPVVQNYGHGHYIGRLEFYYNKKTKKIEKSLTEIYQPTKTCSHFYSATRDCHLEVDKRRKIEQIRKEQFKLIEASFLGAPILKAN